MSFSGYTPDIRKTYIVNKFSKRIIKKNKMQKTAQQLFNYNSVPPEIIKIYISIKEIVKTYDNQVRNEKLTQFNKLLNY
jgi:hypothetical protein